MLPSARAASSSFCACEISLSSSCLFFLLSSFSSCFSSLPLLWSLTIPFLLIFLSFSSLFLLLLPFLFSFFSSLSLLFPFVSASLFDVPLLLRDFVRTMGRSVRCCRRNVRQHCHAVSSGRVWSRRSVSYLARLGLLCRMRSVGFVYRILRSCVCTLTVFSVCVLGERRLLVFGAEIVSLPASIVHSARVCS